MHERRNIRLSAADRRKLEAVVVNRQKHVWRAEIVLLTADERGATEIMQATGKTKCRIGADTLAERIRRSRTRRLQSRKPAAANNHDPTRLVVGKASAPFDTDPVVSSTRTAQWWPSSESTDRCLGAKAADRLLEICDCRGCLGRSRDNGRLKTKAFSLPTFRGLISSGGSR